MKTKQTILGCFLSYMNLKKKLFKNCEWSSYNHPKKTLCCNNILRNNTKHAHVDCPCLIILCQFSTLGPSFS